MMEFCPGDAKPFKLYSYSTSPSWPHYPFHIYEVQHVHLACCSNGSRKLCVHSVHSPYMVSYTTLRNNIQVVFNVMSVVCLKHT